MTSPEFKLFDNLNTISKSPLKLSNDKSFGHKNKNYILSNVSGCMHKTTESNGYQICILCGHIIKQNLSNSNKEWRYYGVSNNDPNRTHIRKVDTKSIHKDIENMNLGEDVVFTANNIYVQVTQNKIYRAKSRKSIVFACVFNAYKILNIPQTPDSLLKMFGIKRKIALKGLKMVGMKIDQTSIKNKYITPDVIIKDILKQFSSTEKQIQEVVDIYHKVRNKSSKLNRSRPKSVASGIVYFWMSKNSKHISLKEFSDIVKLSILTIQKISKEVSRVLDLVASQ